MTDPIKPLIEAQTIGRQLGGKLIPSTLLFSYSLSHYLTTSFTVIFSLWRTSSYSASGMS